MPGEGWKAVGHADTGDGRPALLVHADDERLRRLAVLDAVINNGDRKGGHLLPLPDGRLYAIDHGVTFHVDDKLRTLLWGWAGEELTGEAVARAARALRAAGRRAPLAVRLSELITAAEARRAAQAHRRAVQVRTAPAAQRRLARHPLAAGLDRRRPGRWRPGAPRPSRSRPSATRPPGRRPRPDTHVRVRLKACMPGPLPRSPPCPVRAATWRSTTPRPTAE